MRICDRFSAICDKCRRTNLKGKKTDPQLVDIVANATPVGMNPEDPLPIDPEILVPGQLVTDMIMKPPVTPLLEAAAGMGCPTVQGYEALKGQAAANIAFFGFD